MPPLGSTPWIGFCVALGIATISSGCFDRSHSGEPFRTKDRESRSARSYALVTARGTITANADDLRTGWYPDQPQLGPETVAGPNFGRLWKTTLPLSPGEQVFAQPLVLGTTVLIVTEANSVVALDSETGAVKAARSVGRAWNAADLACGDLRPTVGITGTPVIDVATRTAYFFSKVYLSGQPNPALSNVAWFAHAVDVDTLAERPNFPARIEGAADNDASQVFHAAYQAQRPALLLMDGVVYAGFGGHCDAEDYAGWVIGIGASDGVIRTRFATESGPNRTVGAAIWQSGGGLVSDGPGRIFFITGNQYASADDSVARATPPGDLGQSVVRVELDTGGKLRAKDFFMPFDRLSLDLADIDFGAGGPLALPPSFGTTSHPSLLVAAGKAGTVYILDRDRLGGFRQGASSGDAVVGSFDAVSGLWGHPAAFVSDGPNAASYLYLNSTGGPLQAFKAGKNAAGVPTFAQIGRSHGEFAYGSGSPIVTSSGGAVGTALIWVTYSTGSYGDGQLQAYDALPDADGELPLRFADSFGVQAKFASPGVGDGRLYVGTADGAVIAYGAPITAPVSGPSVDFGTVVVGGTASSTAVLTARKDVNITAFAVTGAAFALGAGTPGLPLHLAAGQVLHVPLVFHPTSAKGWTGALEITSAGGPAQVALRGTGQIAAPLLVGPTMLSFGGVARGATKTLSIALSNGGAAPLTFQGFGAPTGPFSVGVLPAVGATLASGASVTVALAFAPTSNGTLEGTLAMTTNGGSLTVFLSGSAGDPPHLVISPLGLSFGTVSFGASRTLSFNVTNTGGSDLVINKSKPPALGTFVADNALEEGSIIPAAGGVTLNVTFTPNASGAASDQWVITGNDTSGLQTVTFVGTGATAVAHGVRATYFPNVDLSGQTVARVEPNIDFDWSDHAPLPSIPEDDWSARFEADLEPTTSGPVTFTVTSDDGARLWIDGQLVVSNWTSHAPTENSGTISLVAGRRVPLKLEYFDSGGGAIAVLEWSATGLSRAVVPQTSLYLPSGGDVAPSPRPVPLGPRTRFATALALLLAGVVHLLRQRAVSARRGRV